MHGTECLRNYKGVANGREVAWKNETLFNPIPADIEAAIFIRIQGELFVVVPLSRLFAT